MWKPCCYTYTSVHLCLENTPLMNSFSWNA